MISDLAYNKCKPKLNPLSSTSKSRKVNYQFKAKNRCSQYWDDCWTRGKDTTEGNVMLHRRIRNYLGIENDVFIDYVQFMIKIVMLQILTQK